MSDLENTSGLEPLGRAVLVKHYQPERKQGLIEIPDEYAARDLMVEQRAVVVALGPACWPDEPPRAKPGDKVLISRMAGHMAKGTADGQQYRLINDRDIFCAIVKEA
jgi:co-chaperonin GroES (HSP10)